MNPARQGQGDFFTEDAARLDELREQSERARGVYTLERLKTREPERFQWIVAAVQEGRLSVREICSMYDCSDKTVTAIRKELELQSVPVTTVKERLGRRFAGIVHASQERIAEAFADPAERKKITPKDAAIIAGISSQNALVMLGEANRIVEHRDAPTLSDLDQLAQAIEAESMDSVAGATGTKGGANDGAMGGGLVGEGATVAPIEQAGTDHKASGSDV